MIMSWGNFIEKTLHLNFFSYIYNKFNSKKMDNFDLKKYLAENKITANFIIKEEISSIRSNMKGTKVAKTGKYEIRYITDDLGTKIYSVFLDGLQFGNDYDGEGGVLPTDSRISIKNIEKLLK